MNKASITKYDYRKLLIHYPNIIAQMDEKFTSHQFILHLAQQHQQLYVEALYHYREVLHGNKPTPFKYVHTEISNSLNGYRDLIQRIGRESDSKDIFGKSNSCAVWHKKR